MLNAQGLFAVQQSIGVQFMFPVRLKVVFTAAAMMALAGCGSQSMSAAPPAMPASHGVAPAPAQMLDVNDDSITVKKVGVRLTGEQSFNSPTYGLVLGYFKGKTSTLSQVVTLPASTPVVFFNVDTLHPHTASFLGDASMQGANWPSSFNGSSTPSAAGTAIGTTNWSTGAMAPGGKSKKYSTGSPGFYMIGCAFHYNSNGMRTVIIVKKLRAPQYPPRGRPKRFGRPLRCRRGAACHRQMRPGH